MKVAVSSQNHLEAQGLKWVIESHMNGIEIVFREEGEADCRIIDMDLWTPELEAQLSQSDVPWIGLSSDRTFLTAYRALKGRAADLLFRPFDPMQFVKQLQQIRFQLRNRPEEANYFQNGTIQYEDFFSDELFSPSIILTAFAMPQKESYPALYEALKKFPFHERTEFFAFTDFILMVYLSDDGKACMEESRMFYASWKGQETEPLSIFVNINRRETLKQYYQETRALTALIFYEGYDIAMMEVESVQWQSLDPFLTPIEQRIWIEMLQKKNIEGIKTWMENEFLAYSRPYPDPEMIRIRLTSVLAQVRRYMKSVQLQGNQWELRYQKVFEEIVRGTVVYGIVQTTVNFIIELILSAGENPKSGSDDEKVRELMETNYWNADWNLAACAAQMRINKSTLSRRFHQKTGRKFSQALNELRISEAKKLMKETTLSLDEVAKLCGFSNASYFSSVYKKYEHINPSQFRDSFPLY